MRVRTAVIADIHFDGADAPMLPERSGDIADMLLLRAVHRLNRFIRPDVTLVLGDLIDQGGTAAGIAYLERLRPILDLIEGPVIVIPGNHDGDPETFYSVLGRAPDVCDVNGVRFVPFVEPGDPDYNARRTPRDIERMAEARSGFTGPIVSAQHVPLFPPGASECPFNYTNADAVIASMQRHGIGLAISGHYHAGMDLVRAEGLNFVAAPALCESPFRFLEIGFDGDDVDVVEHALRMPDALGLVDAHVHTHFAYCNENMDIAKAMTLADRFGLDGLAFSEHSAHLYFDEPTYKRQGHLVHGIDCPTGARRRMEAYLDALTAAGCPPEGFALEVDCDFEGRPVIRPDDRAHFRFLTGAIHRLRALKQPNVDLSAASDEFLFLLERFLPAGIKVLAHPFRVFRRAGVEVPEELFRPAVDLLRENGVAAEINFHTNEPSAVFVRLCIESGVKLTLGSDAHNLYEVGELSPHLALLCACGHSGDLNDILIDPRRA